MNSEFINIFIQKQKNLINEFQSKLLMAETQAELSNELLKKSTEENDRLKSEIEKLQVKKQKQQPD